MNRYGQVAPAYPAYIVFSIPAPTHPKNFFIFLIFPLDIPRNAWYYIDRSKDRAAAQRQKGNYHEKDFLFRHLRSMGLQLLP